MVMKIALIALLYYPLSIGLTFYQKWLLKSYKLPLFVVCCHYMVKWFAAVSIRFVYEVFRRKRIRLQMKEQLRWLAPIGICASLDIGLSNWALEYVTVSLWRPTLGLEAGLIASGLFLFTWNSTQLDLTGLLLVELAASCTGVRWTVSQLVMQREEQALNHPLDMVAHVQPWMLIPIIPLIVIFEGPELSYNKAFFYNGNYAAVEIAFLIICGGLLAFCMEMSEYLLLVNTSGITLNIFGIVKEVATLLLAHIVNNDRLSWINLSGLVLCLLGMALHGMSRKRQR
ncbi:unnamed protein product [Angiostrongylus costaricensis]|uniref:TPT domain-containing protein n=1 Tax=Angiostrongylus costaricensis TaxID=334426 RepID=A0A0R3Q0C3_ANGCS|nr:unnamed protein product [Angiostrongylus costaricensis]